MYDLKTVLGHADMKTTERYAHLSPDHLASVRNIIKPNIGNDAEVIGIETFNRNDSRPIHAPIENDQAAHF